MADEKVETQNAAAGQNRIDRWTQKLLDFSARNRLLNIPRTSRQVIQLQCPNIAELEDSVASGKPVAIRQFADGMDDREFRKRISDLYHDAKTAIEESGVNTLFLAIGSLQWVDPSAGKNRKPYRAPILMVPVRLERASMADGVKMYRLDEDATINTTLVEFLRSQFSLQVQGIDPLPADDSGVDVPLVLKAFRTAVKDMEGWEILDEAHLGCFSFGKFVMWKDMTDRVDELKKNQLVEHLIGGGGLFDDGIEVFPADEVSKHVDFGKLFCPVSYDSSQLTAVLYSAMGKSFVLHGPPGTGKSQTITNIIAHNLAIGRRVLFVSEKKAALDVVKSRLDRVGLTPFCLEIHSNKTEKKYFYSQLKEALEAAGAFQSDEEWRRCAEDFAKCRAELDGYVEALHRRHPNGLTAYECFSRMMEDGPKTVKIVADALAFDERLLAAERENAARLGVDWRMTSAEAFNALEPVVRDFEWTPAAEREVGAALESLSSAIRKNGFAFLPKAPKGCWMQYSAAEMRAAAVASVKLASYPGFLRWLLKPFAGLGKMKAGADFADKLDVARRFIGESRGVMRYRQTELNTSHLIGTPLAEALENGDFAPEQTQEVFDRSFAEKMLEEIIAKTPELANFAGLRRDERIDEFRRLNAKLEAMSRRVILSKLADRLPLRLEAKSPKGSELGLVRRECEKKIRHKAVRQILAEAPTLIPSLKPCFLMSPLSVAQYLPVGTAPFDLVVFDEASQIPVWDAIGVIARGKQLIVVGDPKQMPPTSFFQKGDAEDEDEDAEEMVEDQESILDECLVAGLHSTYLNWHYRSRHESLIAFSNEHYYDSRLCTFPAAANTPRLGVKFMFVDGGRFEKRGKGPRVNEVEAKALVDYICTEVKKPGYKKRSIGVVTFSLPQQKLIRTMLDERRGEDPALEALLPEEGEGAYFVKNLENVQGDESDVILFSVGYAPDENGRFTMNFGPLNLSGGERRLNVAVTRSKEQVVVFSSIHGSQIDAGEDGRTKAVGAGHLKAFLEYAEKCGAESSRSGANGTGGGFGDVVAAFLKGKGYVVDRNVGRSGFRIDIAVRDPDAPGKYLMGIECDGPSYAGQRTAQDRDVNRVGVLNGLGWHTCRVWSMDWAFDRRRAEERLLQQLESARS